MHHANSGTCAWSKNKDYKCSDVNGMIDRKGWVYAKNVGTIRSEDQFKQEWINNAVDKSTDTFSDFFYDLSRYTGSKPVACRNRDEVKGQIELISKESQDCLTFYNRNNYALIA
jgi:hypothetical protein